MKLGQSSYEQRALGALALMSLCATAGAALLLASLVSGIVDQRQTLADMTATIARAEVDTSTGSRQVATTRLFATTTPAEFQSQLQSQVKDAAARNNMTIETLQILKTERVGGLTRVSLRLDATIPQTALGNFLAELATAEPMVLFQGMEIRPALQLANRLNNGGRQEQSVSGRIDLAAFSSAVPPGTENARRPSP